MQLFSLKISAKPSLLYYSILTLLVPVTTVGAYADTGYVDAKVTQDNEASPTVRLEPIIVTANPLYRIDPSEDNEFYSANVATVGTKTPDYLENIPQSISVVTQSKINDLNIETLDQLAKRTTGLRVLQNDDGRSAIFSRGYEYDQYSIDGLPSPMSSNFGSVPNLAAFDRVEVMRGPSGLFNSASEVGGVVNLVRKRGRANGENTLKASFSHPKGFELSADVQGGVSQDDSLLGRTIIQYNQKDNPVVTKVGGDNNSNTTFYTSIDKYLSDTSRLGMGYLLQSRHITPNIGLPTNADKSLINLPNQDFYGANWNDFNNQGHDFFVDFTHRLDSQGIISLGTRYAKTEADYNYTFAGSALVNNKTNVTALGGDIKQDSLSADINLSQPFVTGKTQSEYVVGADYKRFNSDMQRASTRGLAKQLTADQINKLSPVDILQQAKQGQAGYRLSHEDNTLSETGVYAKVNYKPLDKVSLIAGGRVSHYQVDSENKLRNTHASTSDDKLTGYGAMVYELTPNINVYGSYTQVFTPQSVTNKNNEILKPREGEQIEIGVKGHWDDNLSARLSGYRIQDTNAAAVTQTRDLIALGEREMQGVELEVNGEILPNLQVSGGYSYLDSDIKQASNPRDDGIFLLMPKHTGNLWVNYQANDWFTNPLTIGLGVNVIGDFSSSQGIQADSYQTWEAMLSYPFNDNLEGQLNIYNLFNDHHYVRVGSVDTFNIPDDERAVKASLTYKF